MNDAFERRALLLHLADVLEAVNWLVNHDLDREAVGQLAVTNETLNRLPLLQQVSAHMTSTQFVRAASSAFVEWPRELLEPTLDRKRLASAVRRHLFEDNADGWRAYIAGLRAEVPWFGVGLPVARPGGNARASSIAENVACPMSEEASDGSEPAQRGQPVEQERGSVEATPGIFEATPGIYPTWPWKS